jgi:hypothetical protein
MTILRNVTFYYPKLKNPNGKFDKSNPRWEIQLRTTDKAQVAEWRELGLNPKLAEDEETGATFYRVNLQRKSKNTKTGEAVDPPTVVDSKRRPIDPATVGSGSIGHIKLYQYDTKSPDGEPVRGTTFIGLQLTTYVQFTPSAREDFEEEEGDTEVIAAAEEEGEDDGDFTEAPAKPAPKAPPPKPQALAASGKPKPPATKKTDKDPLY